MENEIAQSFVRQGFVTLDPDGTMRLTQSSWRIMTAQPVIHFVGFKDDRWWNAIAVFGRPDFVHRHWDYHAVSEVCPGDVVVFASGDEHSTPTVFAYDDSAHF
jgi:hypothetical protein